MAKSVKKVAPFAWEAYQDYVVSGLKFSRVERGILEKNLPKSDLVILPGGFSYGDYLRTGCIAAKSGIINEVINYANRVLDDISNDLVSSYKVNNPFFMQSLKFSSKYF